MIAALMASARYGGSQAAPCEELVYDRQPPRVRPLDCINSGLGQNALNDRVRRAGPREHGRQGLTLPTWWTPEDAGVRNTVGYRRELGVRVEGLFGAGRDADSL